MKFNANKVFKFLGQVLESFLKSQGNTKTKPPTTMDPRGPQQRTPKTTATGRPQAQKSAPKPQTAHSSSRTTSTESAVVQGWENGNYPGDYRGRVKPNYNPIADGQPDPGEIVWAWVPYEEDYSQGKDRPVLLVGNDGKYLLALMMTSKDHTSPQKRDSDYVDIGSGPWDKQGRPSEVKIDRVIRLETSGIRREGAVLDKERFGRVAAALTAN